MFDFDCPSYSYDLNLQIEVPNAQEWFRRYHPTHEVETVFETSEIAEKENLLSVGGASKKFESAPPSKIEPALIKKKVAERLGEVNSKIASKPTPAIPKKNVTGAYLTSGTNTRSVTTVSSVPSKKIRPDQRQVGVKKDRPTSATSVDKNAGAPSTKKSKHSTLASCDDDLLSLLKKHNQNCAPPALYEPARHSVRDVRKWEKASGRIWAELKPEERERANMEIAQMKEQTND